MPYWVQCTAVGGQRTFVNLKLIVSMTHAGGHTALVYAGSEDTILNVTDTPEQIIQKPRLGPQ